MSVAVEGFSQAAWTLVSGRTMNFTVPAGANRLVVVVDARNSTGGAAAVSDVTYNGVSITPKYDATYHAGVKRRALWFLNSPPTGSSLVLGVTMSKSCSGVIAAFALSGCDLAVDPTNVLTDSNGSVSTYNVSVPTAAPFIMFVTGATPARSSTIGTTSNPTVQQGQNPFVSNGGGTQTAYTVLAASNPYTAVISGLSSSAFSIDAFSIAAPAASIPQTVVLIQ